MVLAPSEITQEPNFGQLPISRHGLVGYLQHFRSFLDAKATKKSQLHHATLSRVDASKSLQCVIQCNQIRVGLRGYQQRLIKRYTWGCTTSLLIMARAGEICQNPPHQLGT